VVSEGLIKKVNGFEVSVEAMLFEASVQKCKSYALQHWYTGRGKHSEYLGAPFFWGWLERLCCEKRLVLGL
jgi:hypothetical protein